MSRGVKGSAKKFICLQCGKENLWGHSKINKFCDNRCQGDWKWENETRLKIELGEISSVPSLKKYLIEMNGENCFDCGLGCTWQNKKLTLQLEHADGNSDNNLPQNLKLLCPNCHSQTDTYGFKGRGKSVNKVSKRNAYLRNYKASIAQG